MAFEDLLSDWTKEIDEMTKEIETRDSNEWDSGEESSTWYAIPDEVWRA